MTREECEKKILKLLKAVAKVYKLYDPDADYLTMTIWGGERISFNNSYWDKDETHKINFPN